MGQGSEASQGQKATPRTLHPGSSAADAKAVGGRDDFGVPESNIIGRTYTSENTKRADPGGAPARAGEGDLRTSGVGGNSSGVGSSSGGDVDTDLIGIGSGTGISTSAPLREPRGPDDVPEDSGSSQGRSRGVYRAPHPMRGSTVQVPDDQTIGGTGADSAGGTHGDEDASVGEISSDEASGRNDMA